MDDVATRLADLEDLEAIRALKTRYARVCDDNYDADAIAALFVEDGVWDGGPLFGRYEGVDAIRANFVAAPSRIPWALHFTLCPELSLQGPPGVGRTAAGSWYLWQPCTRRSSRGEEWQAYLTGTYRDTYLKTADGWRFVSVRVDARWLATPPTEPAPGMTR